MTTMFQKTVTCAHCQAENNVSEIGSTNAFGSMDLDMRPPPMERDTLDMLIHRCQTCGYCAPDLEEHAGHKDLLDSPGYRAILDDGRYPDLARTYLAHALIAESAGDLVAAALAQRSAAWVCDDQGADMADSARCCRIAVLRLLESLHQADQTFTDDRVSDSILELDLLRRAGQFDETRQRASALLQTALPDILRSISAFQLELAGSRDGACYRVVDAVEGAG